MGDKSPQIFAIVVIAVVGVGRGNHVCDAVGRRGAAHGDRDVPRFRAVIYFWKDVRVNVDHDCGNQVCRSNAAPAYNLNRFAGKQEDQGL
jgi:hypothetical protein